MRWLLLWDRGTWCLSLKDFRLLDNELSSEVRPGLAIQKDI